MQKIKIDYVRCTMRKFWRPFGQNNVGKYIENIHGSHGSLNREKSGNF